MRRRGPQLFLFSVSYAFGRFKQRRARQIASAGVEHPQRKAPAGVRMRRDADEGY
jgi:hypothetical protein